MSPTEFDPRLHQQVMGLGALGVIGIAGMALGYRLLMEKGQGMRGAIGFINRIFAFALAFAILVLLILFAVCFLALVIAAQVASPFAQCIGEAKDLWGFVAHSSITGIPTILLLGLMIYFGRRARRQEVSR